MSLLLTEQKKTRELTEKQQAFLDAVFGEAQGDYKLAAEMAGYAPTSWPQVIRSVEQELIDGAKYILAMYAPRAAHRLGQSLDGGATEPGANIRVAAAEKILDRVGLSKKEQLNVTGQITNALFIIPAKQPVVIDHEK